MPREKVMKSFLDATLQHHPHKSESLNDVAYQKGDSLVAWMCLCNMIVGGL
jgi:hypothetical protein